MFDVHILVDSFDEVNHILVLCLWNVILNFEKFLHVFELGLIFNECLEQSLVLLITNLYEVLRFEDWHNLGNEFWVQDLVHNLTKGKWELHVSLIKSQCIVDDVR